MSSRFGDVRLPHVSGEPQATGPLRPAETHEAPRVAAIWLEGWRDGHLGHVDADLISARTPASFAERARERISQTTVAVVGGEVVGFSMVVSDEVEQLYVDRTQRGTEIASMLLRHAERSIATAGFDVAWLAVVAGNRRARRFYEREGWRDDGGFNYEAMVRGNDALLVPARRYVKHLQFPS